MIRAIRQFIYKQLIHHDDDDDDEVFSRRRLQVKVTGESVMCDKHISNPCATWFVRQYEDIDTAIICFILTLSGLFVLIS